MSIASEITRLQNAKSALKTAINAKGGSLTNETLDQYASAVDALELGGGEMPSTAGGGIFTGATVPLTYKDNTHDYENNYEYKSATHNITITGLDGRATITGNGTKSVTVAFDVTSSTSSLKNFTITCVNGEQTLEYKGLHAHYGTTVTGILTFAYVNITKDGSEGVIGTNYKFIETDSTTLPLFSKDSTLWNTIYSYQVMNVLMGNYSLSSIGHAFLHFCYSFNQPLTLPSNLTSIGISFLSGCRTFNQPLTLPSSLSSIGDGFLQSCYSFNQPLTLPSNLTSIGVGFLYGCSSFNQPLTLPSNLTSIGNGFLSGCFSFNQPLTLSSNLSSIGSSFLYNCYSLSVIVYNASVYPTDNNSLSQNINSKTSTIGAGIIVYGTKRAELMSALANRTSSPYRKLINGGS